MVVRSYLVVACALALAAGPLWAADVTLSANAAQARKPISPWIYGRNENGNISAITNATSRRMGGNRWTAYNWENNASNAGADYFYYNDGFLSNSLTPGEAVRPTITSTSANRQAVIVTVPMAGYVSADKFGTTVQQADYATINPANPLTGGIAGSRFRTVIDRKPASAGPLSLTPNITDAFVYTDEFVNWVKTTGGNRSAPVIYSLDNEPDLWASTHRQIRWNPATNSPVPISYDELRQRSINTALAIKSVDPTAMVFGAVNYGWQGYRTLQHAPNRPNQDFHQYFLQQMKLADTANGKRLVDAIDIHYYPEARGTYTTGGNSRIIEGAALSSTDPAMIQARVQSTRSLWDPTYVETSWITQWSTGGQAMRVIPRLQADINAFYPGTKIAITEYTFGGGNHISGATAQADALGIFGQQGVYAANVWDLQASNTENRFVRAGFDMFLNYDGAGGRFGDTSVQSASSDVSKVTFYASVDAEDPDRIVLMIINKTAGTLTADLSLLNFGTTFSNIRGYQLAGTSTTPSLFINQSLIGLAGLPTLSLQPYSVSAVQLFGYSTVPEPGAVAPLAVVAALLGRRRRT